MKTASTLTNNFLQRFKELGAYLKTTNVILEEFETHKPVTEEEIEKVEAQLGQKLDETFLAYFRESNGFKLKYRLNGDAEEDNVQEGIHIPSLVEVFDWKMDEFSEEGEFENETLGGRDDYEMRSNMYFFDRYDDRGDEPFYYAFYYLITDNVLLFTEDYNACITDANPITPASYFELCLATACLSNRTNMIQKGYDGDFPIVNYPREEYQSLYPWHKSIAKAEEGELSDDFQTLVDKTTALEEE